MTNEQREAIEYLKESVLIYKNTIPKMSNAIDTVLSLIKEQQEEIGKKDEIIDLITYSLADYVMYYNYDRCRNLEMIKNKAKDIKQYFEEGVKNENKN